MTHVSAMFNTARISLAFVAASNSSTKYLRGTEHSLDSIARRSVGGLIVLPEPTTASIET